MAAGAVIGNFEVYVREVHADRVWREMLHELSEEIEGDAVVFFGCVVAPCFRLELGGVECVHVAGDPVVARDALIESVSKGHVHLVDQVGMADPIAEDYSTFGVNVVHGVNVFLVEGAGTYEG